jgi:hypothetical protein
MSKRIITNGKYNVVKCPENTGCGCEFSFDKEDIITNTAGAKVVTCPQCGAECTPNIKPQGAN